MSPLSNPPHEDRQPGDGVELPVDKARAGERHGLIWVLAISLCAAVVAIAGFWLVNFVGHPPVTPGT